jgi:hypothetical protein
METKEMAVCPDCLMAEANGIGDTYADFTEEFKARWAKAEALDFQVCLNEYGEAEGHFSWAPCEHCGDTDGGARYDVIAYGLKTGGNK